MFVLLRIFSSEHDVGDRDYGVDCRVGVRLLGVYASRDEAHAARRQLVEREFQRGGQMCGSPMWGHVEDDAVHVDVHPGGSPWRVMSFVVADSDLCGSEGHEQGVLVFGGEVHYRE